MRKRAVELTAPPAVFDGVMRIRVRTRVAGKLSVRVDSRSRTITVPAATTETEVSLQVTTGPLVRLSLRLRPSKATKLPALSLRRRRARLAALSGIAPPGGERVAHARERELAGRRQRRRARTSTTRRRRRRAAARP